MITRGGTSETFTFLSNMLRFNLRVINVIIFIVRRVKIMKWYYKVLVGILFLVLSPIILFGVICWIISMPFISLSNRKQYKKSPYYLAFNKEYTSRIFNSNRYAFYNFAVDEKLPIEYIVQKTNSLEYFILDGIIYIFPDFNEIVYNSNLNDWGVIYRRNSEEDRILLTDYMKRQLNLFETTIELPVKILVARSYFEEQTLDISSLPECIKVIRDYSYAFKEDINTLSIIPETTEDLYKMMLMNDKLGGKFELIDNEIIEWEFDDFIYQISLDGREGLFDVIKNNKLKMSITHWHPDLEEVYTDICKIGEKGNLLVVKTFLGSAIILYMGKKENCPYLNRKVKIAKYHFLESK